MNNSLKNYTNPEELYLSSEQLYEKTETIAKYLLQVKDSLIKISSYIENIGDDKVWQSPAGNHIKEKFMVERQNYQLLYNVLKDYVSYFFKINNLTEEATKKADKIMEDLEINNIWLI